MLLLLLACSPEPTERQLSVEAGSGGDASDTGVYDSSATHPGSVDDAAYTQGLLCGDGDPSDDPTGDDVFAATECVRVTPEEVFDDVDTGGDTGATAPAPPCGFVNLVGGLAVAGPPTAPVLLYCDADEDGGTRAVHYEPEHGLLSTMISPVDCSVEPGAAAFLPVSDGWLGLWASSVTTRDNSSSGGVMAIRVDGDAQPLDAAMFVEGEVVAWKLAVVPGDPAVLLVTDFDTNVWSVSIEEDGGYFGKMTPVTSGARGIGALRVGASIVAAVCPEDAPLRLVDLDATGLPVGERTLSDTLCSWSAAPSFATDGSGYTLAWDDGEHGWISFFDAAGTELNRVDLGDRSTFPVVTWTGTEYLSLDATGALSSWSPTGEPGATRWFAGIVDAPGSVGGLRMEVQDDELAIILLGLDNYPIGGGHVNAFNYVEVNSAPLPTP